MNPKTPVYRKLLRASCWSTRLVRGLAITGRLSLILGILLALAMPALAAPAPAAPAQAALPQAQPTPSGQSGTSAPATMETISAMFKGLAGLFAQIAFSLMFILFAVGSVKSGLGAQWAHNFGIAHRLSDELLNLGLGVVIFALGLLTLTLAQLVMTQVAGHIGADITIPPLPNINIH